MNRKTIVIAMLLVAAMLFAGCQVTMTPTDPQKAAKAEAKKAEKDTLERIRTYKIVQEETLLIRDILQLKAEVAKIQAANAPPAPATRPAIPARQKVDVPGMGEGEFVPMAEVPAEMK